MAVGGVGQLGAEALREARYVFGGEEDGGEFRVVFGDFGQVFGADLGYHVHHQWEALVVAAAGPLGLLLGRMCEYTVYMVLVRIGS